MVDLDDIVARFQPIVIWVDRSDTVMVDLGNPREVCRYVLFVREVDGWRQVTKYMTKDETTEYYAHHIQGPIWPDLREWLDYETGRSAA